MIYGYARVSSTGQNLATQIEALKAAGCDKVVEEKVTGVAKEKERLDELLNDLQEGDTLIVSRMDRLGRCTLQLLTLVEELKERGVHLVILDLGIDTRTANGEFILTVFAAFSQLERNIIKEKTAAGIALAKKNGKYKGRPKKYTANNPKLVQALADYQTTDKTVKEICKTYSIGRTTLYDNIKRKGIVREVVK